MSIKVYRDQPFDSSTEVDLIDIFSGLSTQTSYTLTKKTGVRVGGLIEFDSTQYLRYNGGFTISGNTINLSVAPGSGSTGIVPGLNCLTFSAFNEPNVPGLTNSNQNEVPFYIGNGTNVYLESYVGVDGSGIKVSFINLIDIDGLAEVSWMQLASATQDEAGNPGSYLLTGEPLYTPNIDAYGTCTTTVTSLSTEIGVSSIVDNWIVGDFILLNPGNSNSERVKLLGVLGDPVDTLQTTPLNYNHTSGEFIYACVRKLWGKMTVPEGTDSPETFINISLNLEGATRDKI